MITGSYSKYDYKKKFLNTEIKNERSRYSYKTALNIFLDISESKTRKRSKEEHFTNFKNKDLINFDKGDIMDFFAFLNNDSNNWALSSKKVIFAKIKVFLTWLIDRFEKQLLGDLTGVDRLTLKIELMDLEKFINNNKKFTWEKSGHKNSDSNKDVFLEISELKNLFQTLRDYEKPYYEIMYRLLIETGCRISEFCSIMLDTNNGNSIPIEADLKERKIRVKWLKTTKKQEYKFYAISEDFKTILEKFVKSRRLENKDNPKLSNNLFLSKPPFNCMMTSSNIWYSIKSYCRKAGIIKSVSPHVFRRTINYHRYDQFKTPEREMEILLNHGSGSVNTQSYLVGSLMDQWDKILELYDKNYPYKELFSIK